MPDAQPYVRRHSVALFVCRERGPLVHIKLVLTRDIVHVEDKLHPVPRESLLQGEIPACVFRGVDVA